jgi:hypothetical protein
MENGAKNKFEFIIKLKYAIKIPLVDENLRMN